MGACTGWEKDRSASKRQREIGEAEAERREAASKRRREILEDEAERYKAAQRKNGICW